MLMRSGECGHPVYHSNFSICGAESSTLLPQYSVGALSCSHAFSVPFFLSPYTPYSPWLAVCVLCLAAQLCLTLCDPMDHSPPGSPVHGNSPGKNTRVGYHALLQGIFPTQGLNPGFVHCRKILYHLSHQGSPSTSCLVLILLINFSWMWHFNVSPFRS